MVCSAEGHEPEHGNPLLNQARFPTREEFAKHNLGCYDWKESLVIRAERAETGIAGWSLRWSAPVCIVSSSTIDNCTDHGCL